MAASPMLHGQIVFLLQQQLLNQVLKGESSSLTDILLQRRKPSGREITAKALTGGIRADSGMLRQASKNVREGGTIAGMAKTGVSTIITSLKEMRSLAWAVSAGTANPDAAGVYAKQAEAIKGVVESTAYNGISLMDKKDWGIDERLKVSSNGADIFASLSIQAGRGIRNIVLTDFSGMAEGSTVNATLSQANADDLASELSLIIQNMQLHEKSFDSLEYSMNAEAKRMDRNSRILELTAARAISGVRKSPAPTRLYKLLMGQGNLIDDSF